MCYMKYAASNPTAVRNSKLKQFKKNTTPKKVAAKKKSISVNSAVKPPKESFLAQPKPAETKAVAAKPKTQKVNIKNPIKAARGGSKIVKLIPSAQTNKIIAGKNSKAVAKKIKQVVSNKKNVRKIAPRKSVKPVRAVKNTAPKVSVKSAKIKTLKNVASQIKVLASAKKNTTKENQKQSMVLVKKVEKARPQKSSVPVKTAKAPKIKTSISAKKAKKVAKKVKNIIVSKPKDKGQKVAPRVSAKKNKLAAGKIKPMPLPKTGKTKAIKTVISNSRRAETKSAQVKQIASAAKVNTKSKAVQLVYSATTGKVIEAKSVASVSETKPKAQKIKVGENKIETVNSPLRENFRKKKIKPIGTAVFRGKKERYDFKVFSIKEEIENVPAIYVISRRKTDKQNRGHHALVCIGQTDSILDEIKKHQKSKCVKKFDANVISILPEENEKKRLKIETDLRAAHTIPCIYA